MSLRRLCPHVPHSLPTERFHPFSSPSPAAASDLVSFSGSDDGEMDDSLSLAASDAEELSGSSHDPASCSLRSPAHPAQAWTPIFSTSYLMLWRSWVWSGLLQRNRPVAAWMNGSCWDEPAPSGPSSTSINILP